jgi:oligopeptidase B
LQVPVTLVYNKHAVDRSKPTSLHLNAYGAYEHTFDPSFSKNMLSLVDRSIVYAIAHVRGGGDLGRQWYETGKYLAKKNTFLDVIAAAEYLVSEGWTTAQQMTFEGRSAGGLTAGAVTNMRPDLFTVRLLPKVLHAYGILVHLITFIGHVKCSSASVCLHSLQQLKRITQMHHR